MEWFGFGVQAAARLLDSSACGTEMHVSVEGFI